MGMVLLGIGNPVHAPRKHEGIHSSARPPATCLRPKHLALDCTPTKSGKQQHDVFHDEWAKHWEQQLLCKLCRNVVLTVQMA